MADDPDNIVLVCLRDSSEKLDRVGTMCAN